MPCFAVSVIASSGGLLREIKNLPLFLAARFGGAFASKRKTCNGVFFRS
jgi:hypothetical protein